MELEVSEAGSDSVCIYLSQDNGPVASCYKHIYEISFSIKVRMEVHIVQYCHRPFYPVSVTK